VETEQGWETSIHHELDMADDGCLIVRSRVISAAPLQEGKGFRSRHCEWLGCVFHAIIEFAFALPARDGVEILVAL
jgi:hypothetical protein